MNVLLVSHNYPPESNALARRSHAHARHWVEAGERVEVLTDVPSFPEGEVYDGYANRYAREEMDGVVVHRCPLLPLENRGAVRRASLYASFMASATWHGRRLDREPDVVVASSPHLFSAVAGRALSRIHGTPFVLEIRDLWPQSVVASDVLPADHWLVRGAGRVADHLYRAADAIVVVTEAFRRELVDGGVDPAKIAHVPNGVDPSAFASGDADHARRRLRSEVGLDGRFLASYLGTVGRAHRAEVLYEAAERSGDDLGFLVVGPGSEWEALRARQEENPLPNFRLLDKQPPTRVPDLLALSDVSVVHLKDRPLFRTVVPSKLFEAMAAGNPVVLGVRGEAAEIVESTGAGLTVPPESPEALAAAVRRLRENPDIYEEMSRNGRRAVRERFDRRRLADSYRSLLGELTE